MTQQLAETSKPSDQDTDATNLDTRNNGTTIKRQNPRGCSSKEFCNWPDEAFENMDSPLAVQMYIQQLIRNDPSNVDAILTPPEGQDLGAWKIEHLRMFCMQLNRLAARLQECCFPETCNQMTATEQWIFLCAAHKQPNECSAIDYTRHTLDGAASLLNSNKYFPSRVTIKDSSVAKLASVCRRVYRIFSHAYYHHFQLFDEFERETFLCRRFSKFATRYDLMPRDSLIVPADSSQPPVTSGQSESAATYDESQANQGPNVTMFDPKSSRGDTKPDSSPPTAEPSAPESGDENQNNQPDWSPSPSSTNTIMKSSSSAKSNPNDAKSDSKITDEVSVATQAQKNVESEA